MNFTTLISPPDLAAHLDDPAWAIIDCRFVLADPAAGRQHYLAGHVPGACYAHLDEDLSSPIVPGQTGRHPLPAVAHCARTFSQWGIDDQVQVVVYDDASGAFAGRLWWLLRWLGHDAVAVLDGDWRALGARWGCPRAQARKPAHRALCTQCARHHAGHHCGDRCPPGRA